MLSEHQVEHFFIRSVVGAVELPFVLRRGDAHRPVLQSVVDVLRIAHDSAVGIVEVEEVVGQSTVLGIRCYTQQQRAQDEDESFHGF